MLRENNNLSHAGWKKKSLQMRSVCSIWESRTWKCLGAPEPPHVRIFVWNFPSCPRQLFHILSACLLSGFIQTTRVRGAQPCGAAQIHLLFFFDTWQIINGGLAALRRSSVWTHQMRCLTAQVHTDKNLLTSVFMRLVHHSSWLWFMLWAEFLQLHSSVTFV